MYDSSKNKNPTIEGYMNVIKIYRYIKSVKIIQFNELKYRHSSFLMLSYKNLIYKKYNNNKNEIPMFYV